MRIGQSTQNEAAAAIETLAQLDAVRRFAFQLCRDQQTTADLVQETMLRALRSLHTYRQGTNCRAWLFQICKNAYINAHRRRQYEPIPVDFQEEEAGYEGAVKPQETGWSDEVLKALDRLPEEYRTAVLLSDVEGLPYEEIAEFTQAPIGTVRSRIHRGRRLLARVLEPYARQRGAVEPRCAA
jgi:RNA polymerase sigma-70 factor (ECF subfamily)